MSSINEVDNLHDGGLLENRDGNGEEAGLRLVDAYFPYVIYRYRIGEASRGG
jgi:hypothetical protein